MDTVGAWLVSLGFTSAMLLAWGLGWKLERRNPTESPQDPGTKFTDASMALLGLLLGFTFSMSLTRHEQRRQSVVSESNAIGDFYTCASLLKAPIGPRLVEVTRDYAEHKLDITRGTLSEADLDRALQRFNDSHTKMTQLVADAVTEGTPVTVPLTTTLNALISSEATRLAAYRDRLPWSILFLLLISSIVPAFLMGKQQGISKVLHLTGTLAFIFLVTMVILVTLDLNQPGRGTITVSQEPMERLLKSMGK